VTDNRYAVFQLLSGRHLIISARADPTKGFIINITEVKLCTLYIMSNMLKCILDKIFGAGYRLSTECIELP